MRYVLVGSPADALIYRSLGMGLGVLGSDHLWSVHATYADRCPQRHPLELCARKADLLYRWGPRPQPVCLRLCHQGHRPGLLGI